MDPPAGISAITLTRTALAQVGHSSATPLTDRELARWLVEQRFAEPRPGRPSARDEARRVDRRIAASARRRLDPSPGRS